MGGVDTLSRVVVPYALARKGVKWYRKLAEVFIDFAIYNSFIIWKKLTASKKNNYQFREQLIDAIIMFHFNPEGNRHSGPTSKPIGMKDPLRLKERHFCSPIRNHPGGKRSRRKCVRCTAMKKRSDTAYQCVDCDIGLCFHPCFKIYHTTKFYYLEHNPTPFIEEEEEEVEIEL